MRYVFKINLAFAFSAVIFLFSGFAVDTNAQNRRTNSRPVSTPTPTVRQITTPEIIYQTGDLPEQQIEVTENQPLPPPESVASENERLTEQIRELKERIKTLETNKNAPADEKEKRLLLNLDILTRAEQRAEGLRKQLIDLVDKENTLRSKLDQVIYELRPEMIDRSAALTGSLRPEDIRDSRRKSLEAEKTNIENLLTQIESNRISLETRVQRADSIVERIREKFEREIDASLGDEPEREN